MINITEIAPPRKVSGLTSLWVTFNYNDAIVSSMKSMPTFYFHKKELAWEIPINHLAQLLDTLTFLDDIDLKLLNDSEFDSIYPVNISTQENTQDSLNGSTQAHNEYVDKSLTLEERQEFKSKIFKHQLEGINYGLNHNRFLLLDTMGLGKTLETIYLAETLKRRGLIEHCFIICGVNSLKSNWKAEIKKFSKESCLVLGEKISRNGTVSYTSVKQRAEQLKNPIEEFFVICNIESIRSEEMVKAIMNGPNKFGLIAVDEIHRCLTEDTLITTNEGLKTIKEIVDNKLDVKILTKDTTTNELSYQPILEYSKVCPYENTIELTFKTDDNKQHTLTCSENHLIYTKNRGYVKAKDLKLTDEFDIDLEILS